MNIPVIPQVSPQVVQKNGSDRRHNKTDGLAKPAQDFEAIFLHALFKGMRSTTIDGGLFEKGKDREIFLDFLDMEMAKAAAAQNALGIGQALLKQLQDPDE